jgi:trk system potassium uptake protein TrkH
MNLKLIARFLGQIVALEAAVLIPALSVSLGYGEFSAATAIAGSMAIMLAVAGVLWLLGRKSPKRFGPTEGMVCVGLSWVVLSMLGALPFFLSGSIPRYIDALFEIVSGFTTTGASILPNVEALARGLLYWRSFSHWVGGMGVLVLLLAIAPGEGQGFTMHLLRAESPGPDVGKLVPKMRKTAAILYGMYMMLTVLCFVFLLLGKMPLFDAVCTAFGTAGTGGFGVKADSLASYSPYLQNVTTVFMFLFGINFSCYYLLLLGNLRSVLRDQELHLYLGMFLTVTVLIVFSIRPLYPTLGETVRHAAFQVSSIMTTTGFATTDFDLWPSFAKGLLMLLMVVGACAGSTGGGLKCARVLLLFKSLGRNIRRVTSPKKVEVVRSNGKTVSESIVDNTNAYLAAYLVIIVLSYLVLTLDGQTVGTTLSAVLACFNNIGPGFEAVGPTCNFLFFGDLSKCVLIFDMLAGRLEIFPMLILFSKLTWRK